MALSMPAAVVLCCCLACATYVGYREYEHHRERAEVQQVVDQVQEIVATPSRVVPAVDPRILSERREAARPRRLSADQRCIGGTVVLVSGSSYVQTTEPCRGNFLL